MTTNDKFNFSVDTVPDEWTEAVQQAPSAGSQHRPTGRGGPKVMPSRQKTDVFSAGFLGVAVAIASGIGWYFLEVNDPGYFWWAPAAIGLLIGFGVRLAGGSASPGLSFAVSTVLFCLTVFVTGIAIARFNLVDQLAAVDADSLESQLIFDQFTRMNSWLGLVGGFLAMSLTSFGAVKRS